MKCVNFTLKSLTYFFLISHMYLKDNDRAHAPHNHLRKITLKVYVISS